MCIHTKNKENRWTLLIPVRPSVHPSIRPSKGVWFLFFPVITYVLLPSSPMADFTGFFFPSGFGVGKKNRQLNWISTPNQGKKQTCLGFIHDFFRHGFFFSDEIPRENKKPLKYLLPSYFLGGSTVLYVITWKNKNHTPLLQLSNIFCCLGHKIENCTLLVVNN